MVHCQNENVRNFMLSKVTLAAFTYLLICCLIDMVDSNKVRVVIYHYEMVLPVYLAYVGSNSHPQLGWCQVLIKQFFCVTCLMGVNCGQVSAWHPALVKI